MTGIDLKTRDEEEADVTYAPAIVALGLLVTAVTVTLWAPGVIVSIAIVTTGIVFWVRESVRQNRTLVPSEERRGFPERFGLRTPTTYWWGAAGFGLIQLVATGAALRAAHAHGLLDPGLLRLPLDMWIGHGATVAVALTSLAALWGTRTMARPTGPGWRPFLFLLLGIMVHLGLLGLQLLSFVQGEFFAGDRPKASATGYVFGVHAAFTLGTAVAVIVLLVRMRLARLHAGAWGVAHAVALFWWTVAFSWLLVYAALYLRLIRIGSYLI